MNAESPAKPVEPESPHPQPWDDQLSEMIQLPPVEWQEDDYQPFAHVKSGLLLGAIAGCVSLLANVIGSVLWPAISGQPQHALRLIQVYLTFPLGEYALQLESGYVLALGSLLYIATGMLYGTLLVLGMSYVIPRAEFEARFVFCSIGSVILWIVNFYLLLSWLQPWLFGGRWIVQLVPWWVAAVTHFIFGLTIAMLYPFAAVASGHVDPARRAGRSET
jgi:hypothetical protein